MPLTLHFHPLASFCWKAMIALYENETPFDTVIVDLGDAGSREVFAKISPLLKMPALVDSARGKTILESTIVVEYLDTFYTGRTRLVPADPDAALQARMWDRFYDNYLQHPMQKIIIDTFRPEGGHDTIGVAEAQEQIKSAYRILNRELADKTWAIGEAFTLADCAALPALAYCDCIVPFGPEDGVIASYLERLRARPSVHRTLRQAEPFFPNFPWPRKPRL